MKWCFLLIFFSLFLFSCDKDNIVLGDDLSTSHKSEKLGLDTSSPFPYCQTNPNPIGGGSGYNDVISPLNADIYIDYAISVLNFKNVIENALPGSIIYIDSNLTIDLSNIYLLTGSYSIEVPGNITIASGRGRANQLGAIIKTNDFEWNMNEYTKNANPLFEIKGDNVRFTGLRFQGPSSEIGVYENPRIKSCIRIQDNYKNLKVDNNEFYAWPFAAIRIGGFHEYQSSYHHNYIQYNYFHDNKQIGYGNGVAVDRGYALIEGNLFAKNRHDIGATGRGKCSYEASCNTVLSGGIGHNFDMHAGNGNDSTPVAGQYINIHHNVFYDVGADRLNPWNVQNIYIRGRPTYQCRIENNKFAHIDPNVAILQQNGYGGYGNMLVWNNIYGTNKYLGWYIKKNWFKNNTDNFLNIPSSNDNIMSPPASGSDYDFAYEFGDLDGNSKTDIFKLENSYLYTTPMETSIFNMEDWVPIKQISTGMSTLKFLFFNNDSYTDIVRKAGHNMSLLYGPLHSGSQWNTLLPNILYDLPSFKFGDFNGNGHTDIFLVENNQWKVLFDSNPTWQIINSSSHSSNQLRIGKFDGNNKSDVFVADGNHFKISFDGTSAWYTYYISNLTTSDLLIVDFNGDNISDIINIQNNKVLIYNELTWKDCNLTNFPITSFSYGNF